MTETTQNGYYRSILKVRDCDDNPAPIRVTVSTEDYGTDIELEVTAWDGTATAYLTPVQAGELIDKLTSAIGYATAPSDID